tara:strand:- start:1363 stop:1800 length:438 start_codon:yes stop_codon:yes gene_type:complete
MSQFPTIVTIITHLNLHSLWLRAFLAVTAQAKLSYLEGLASQWADKDASALKKAAIEQQFVRVFERTRRLPALRAKAAELMKMEPAPTPVVEEETDWDAIRRVFVVEHRTWIVSELKDELRAQGLPVSGKKEELVQRLADNLPTS